MYRYLVGSSFVLASLTGTLRSSAILWRGIGSLGDGVEDVDATALELCFDVDGADAGLGGVTWRRRAEYLHSHEQKTVRAKEGNVLLAFNLHKDS